MIRRHLTYANVMATLALFFALGGVAFAAATLGKNAVKTRNIAPKAVKLSKIAPNAVNSNRVKDRSLLAKDFKAGQLPSGPEGKQGPQGPQGPAGATSVVAHRTTEPEIGTGGLATASATCDPGETLVGGGAAFVTAGTNLYDFPATLNGSVPTGEDGKPVLDGATGHGWRASAKNETGSTRDFVVIALCASP